MCNNMIPQTRVNTKCKRVGLLFRLIPTARYETSHKLVKQEWGWMLAEQKKKK